MKGNSSSDRDARGGRIPPPHTGVRPEWLKAVVTTIQVAAGRASFAVPIDVRPMFENFARSLPEPHRPSEHLLLRGLLLEFAVRTGAVVHRVFHGAQPAHCAFVPAALVERVWATESADARLVFARWANVFCDELSLTHPPSAAERAAGIVRERCAEPWRVDSLARRVHVTAGHLRREFRSEFGMSIREYQRVVRLAQALESMPHVKVEAVAHDVGYRSKKNFYRAFLELTGFTPQAYRQLSPEQSARVREAIVNLMNGRVRCRSA